MAYKNKYQREKQQYSNDGGMTWLDVSPANYRRGRLLEAASEDCNTIEWREVLGSWFCIGFEETVYRWVTVSGQYVCVGYDKHTKEKKQQSTDGGTTWTDVVPLETRAGSLIQANSEDCGYVPPTPSDYSTQYLTFEVVDEGTITFTNSRAEAQLKISYSTDNGSTWTEVSSSINGKILGDTLNVGDKVLVKGTNSSYGFFNAYTKFGGTAKVNVYGNIMSLIYGDNFVNNNSLTRNYTFKRLFYGYSNLLSAENLILPATTLADYCYLEMFHDCTSLVKAPALPATTLTNWCYQCMFWNCKSLVNAPVLPATTLTRECYDRMFQGCTSLVNAPELPATTLAYKCYGAMFRDCTGLTTAPELPATTLAQDCYNTMFEGCTSLTTAPELPATILAEYCYIAMFEGCTSLETAPVLTATTLVDWCYASMFKGCTKLNYIKCLATDISANNCTSNWVEKVASSGTFTKAGSMTSWTTGVNGIPRGWTVVTE